MICIQPFAEAMIVNHSRVKPA